MSFTHQVFLSPGSHTNTINWHQFNYASQVQNFVQIVFAGNDSRTPRNQCTPLWEPLQYGTTPLQRVACLYLFALAVSCFVLPVGSMSATVPAVTEEKEKRPSGLGHTVTATTGAQPQLLLSSLELSGWEEVTTEKTPSGYGDASPLRLEWCFLFVTPPNPHPCFFTPLEIVLSTWVDKSFLCSPIYSHFVFAMRVCRHSRGERQRGNVWERAFCWWFERVASSRAIGRKDTNTGRTTFTGTQFLTNLHAVNSHLAHLQREIFVPA